jgi:osomolarity two-component system response regulator SSK1
MDIQLPVMDGIEATKEIRKLERAGNIGILPGTPPTTSMPATSPHSKRDEWLSPDSISSTPPTNPAPFRPSVIIVALTASVFNSDRVAALAAGCNDFLNKPVSHAWLEKKIIEWGSMQYILLAGFDHHGFSQNLGASKAIASAVASGPKPTVNSSSNTNSKPGQNKDNGRAALFAAMNNSEIRENFGNAPDRKAQEMAGKLHINPGRKSKSSSSGFSTGSSSAEDRLHFESSS